MKTSFIHAKVRLFDGLAFYLDGNSKITWGNGTYEEPTPNALSLPHISCCPGSTERCRASCYVHGLRAHVPELYKLYELNEMALHSVLMTPGCMQLASEILADWITKNAAGGFRWHVSGDVFSQKHARFIRDTCLEAPDVPFWIYTRTLDAVPLLVQAKNLSVNVSADAENFARAKLVAQLNDARLCYLVSSPDEAIPELPEDSVIFPDYPLRGRDRDEPTEHPWWKALPQASKRIVCVADFFGQSSTSRCGPCDRCLYPKETT